MNLKHENWAAFQMLLFSILTLLYCRYQKRLSNNLFKLNFQPFVVACGCVYQRKNKCFHLGAINNEFEDSMVLELFL